jgi:hypothetical protein
VMDETDERGADEKVRRTLIRRLYWYPLTCWFRTVLIFWTTLRKNCYNSNVMLREPANLSLLIFLKEPQAVKPPYNVILYNVPYTTFTSV